MTNGILRYWETVRHLSATQVLSRVRLRIAARARRQWPAAAVRALDARVKRAQVHWRDELLGRASTDVILPLRAVDELERQATDVGAGRFRFLNESGDLGWPPNWAAPQHSQLWRYHLHYFDVLPQRLAATSISTPLVEHWITANPVHGNGATPDAWHPYVVSLRMVNWMLGFTATSTATELTEAVRASLIAHAVFLERNLETDVGGNHLLKNLKAMVFAGCFWDGATADGWRHQYVRAFVEELSRQVLADGGHYERSPMYHCQVMGDAVEVAAVLAARGAASAELLQLLDRMDHFLAIVSHPDGGIALFNDSAFGVAPEPRVLHQVVNNLRDRAVDAPAGSRTGSELQQAALESGYVPLPCGDSSRYLLADVGMVCPDDLPAHAHADLFSFELSLEGVRLIVDSGVGEYAAGAWRDYYRSTRAHNTVMVDGLEQSDCWSSFRVGRRARPARVVYDETSTHATLDAEHTGYDDLASAVRHHRRFSWLRDGGCWIVTDTLRGTGEHEWASFCHVHPDAAVEQGSDAVARITREGHVLDVCWFGFDTVRVVHGDHDPLQGWHAERFGPAVPAAVLIFEGRRVLPAAFGYALVPQVSTTAAPASISVQADGSIVVVNGERRYRVTVPSPAENGAPPWP